MGAPTCQKEFGTITMMDNIQNNNVAEPGPRMAGQSLTRRWRDLARVERRKTQSAPCDYCRQYRPAMHPATLPCKRVFVRFGL